MSIQDKIREVLDHLNPGAFYRSGDKKGYGYWLEVGAHLKYNGLTCEDWETWSLKDPEHYSKDCDYKWKTFDHYTAPLEHLFQLCEIYAHHKVILSQDELHELKGIQEHQKEIEKPFIQLSEPGEEWDPAADMQKFLMLLYNPNDFIAYCVSSKWDQERQKYNPQGRDPRDYSSLRTVREIIEELENGEPIEEVFGQYSVNAGAWIVLNPITGKPDEKGKYATKDCIADYRYCLIESDETPVDQAVEIYQKMKLPVAAITYSGSRSAHAVIRINAGSKEEFSKRVNRLFEECDRYGLIVDRNNNDIARLSRAPGFFRNGHKQYLMAGSFGPSSYEEWEETLYKPMLPEPISANMIHDPPPRPLPIIQDTLNPGEVMLLSGPPKAGKSFLTMQLALAVATGREFITLKCKKGKVLYVDGELSCNALIYRVRGIMEKMGMQRYPDNLKIVPVSDMMLTLDNVISDIEHADNKPDLIILDPYYVFSEVNENDNSELRGELKNLSRLKKMNVAVIVVHHQTKGSQAGKSNIDRAAGGSTFARFADTVSSLNLLERKQGDDFIPERFESDNRNFPPRNHSSQIDLMFDGIHFPDRNGSLSDRGLYEPGKAFKEKARESQIGRTNTVYLEIKSSGLLSKDGTFTISDYLKVYRNIYGENRDRKTIKDDLIQAGFQHDEPESGNCRHFWKDEDFRPENGSVETDVNAVGETTKRPHSVPRKATRSKKTDERSKLTTSDCNG